MKLQKTSCSYNTEVDKISKLPGHIIDNILSRLSIWDAGRTSIWSTNWRYKWTKLPHLVFDNKSVNVHKLVKNVDHVLMMHHGPIERFSITHRGLEGVIDIDRWICFLSGCSVKELVLDIWVGDFYKPPYSLYLCQNLVHLELCNCILRPPITFNGFKTLKSLVLDEITMEENAFDYMISSCLLLEKLTLKSRYGFTNLKIHAPNLFFLDIKGFFESVNFQDTCHLSIVSVHLDEDHGVEYNLTSGILGNLIKKFAHLPRIQKLKAHNNFLKYLSARIVPRNFPRPCLELSFLSLHINFNDMDECLAALCLLRSSPNLIELEIEVSFGYMRSDDDGFGDIVEDKSDNCLFNHLKIVTVIDISGLKQELNFIKYILAKSPLLEKMTINPTAIHGGLESLNKLMKKLLLFKRTSMHAQIIFEDLK